MRPEVKFGPAKLTLRIFQTYYLRLIAEPLHHGLAARVANSAFAVMSRDITGIDELKTGSSPNLVGMLKGGYRGWG